MNIWQKLMSVDVEPPENIFSNLVPSDPRSCFSSLLVDKHLFTDVWLTDLTLVSHVLQNQLSFIKDGLKSTYCKQEWVWLKLHVNNDSLIKAAWTHQTFPLQNQTITKGS